MVASVAGGLPGLGNLIPFVKAPMTFIQKIATLGDSVKFQLGPYRSYLLTSPSDVNEVLINQGSKFHKDALSVMSGKKFLGKGLLVNDGQDHLIQRRRIQPAFHQTSLARYADVMVAQSKRMVETWQPGEMIPVDVRVSETALRIVAQTLFNANVEEDIARVRDAMLEFNEIMKKEYRSPLAAMMPDWLPTAHKQHLRHSQSVMNNVVWKIIDQHRENPDKAGEDILSLIMAYRDDGEMTMQQLRDEVVDLFIAGHETTSTVLAWAFYFIGSSPEIDQKIKAEINTVLAGRLPTVDDVPKLKYTYMLLKEVLRFYPPGWMFGRMAMEDTQVGETVLKKGDFVYLSPYITQRDSRYFDDPDTFKPERFENEKNFIKGSYFPFGAGPHVCIGQHFGLMEAALFLATAYSMKPNLCVQDAPMGLDIGITIHPNRHIMVTV